MQEGNVNLSIYNIPEKKGMMEAALLDYTRAYFPEARFDTAFIEGNYIFGKKEDTYVAMIGAHDFHFRDQERDDVIQPGKRTFWITEAGSAYDDGSFGEFYARIKGNSFTFDSTALQLDYTSAGNIYALTFGGSFMVNEKVMDTEYKRYDSPYVQAERKDATITFAWNGERLFLDFENLIRKY
jgi:hypothetical protein